MLIRLGLKNKLWEEMLKKNKKEKEIKNLTVRMKNKRSSEDEEPERDREEESLLRMNELVTFWREGCFCMFWSLIFLFIIILFKLKCIFIPLFWFFF
jgi:hypothetical protein